MPFGVVSGVSGGMGVSGGGPHASRGREGLGFCIPIGLNGVFV